MPQYYARPHVDSRGGIWLLENEPFDVMEFGAAGDGVTDDTAAIQAAMNAAARPQIASHDFGQGEGGVVFFPRGVYKITAPLVWTTDNLWLVGENRNTASILVALASNPATTDAITISNGTGNGRRSGLRNISIYSADTNGCRDLVFIDAATWWRIEDVDLYQAGRYGLHIGGTLDGTAINLRTSYNGDSGVFISADSLGTGQTTTDFYHLYSHNNQKHGVLVERSHVTNFYGPIVEFNGQGGDATQGDGIRLGTTVDAFIEINLFGPYFESNLGWDIKSGVAATGGNRHSVSAFGGFAEATSKAAGYGYLHATRTQGVFFGGRLSNYQASTSHKSYSIDSTCMIDILGPQGDVNDGAARNTPIYRDIAEWLPNTVYALNDVVQNQDYEYICITAGTSAASGGPTTAAADITDNTAHWAFRGVALNNYAKGLVEWPNADSNRALYGKLMPYVGGPGAGRSIGLRRFSSSASGPSDGTAARGDFSFNLVPNLGTPFAWVASAAGAPGTWKPAGYIPSVTGGQDANTDPTLTPPIETIQRYTTALTANRTVTLSTTGAQSGMSIRIVRTAGDTGGPWTLSVGGLKNLLVNQWCDVAYTGSAWVLTGFGSL